MTSVLRGLCTVQREEVRGMHRTVPDQVRTELRSALLHDPGRAGESCPDRESLRSEEFRVTEPEFGEGPGVLLQTLPEHLLRQLCRGLELLQEIEHRFQEDSVLARLDLCNLDQKPPEVFPTDLVIPPTLLEFRRRPEMAFQSRETLFPEFLTPFLELLRRQDSERSCCRLLFTVILSSEGCRGRRRGGSSGCRWVLGRTAAGSDLIHDFQNRPVFLFRDRFQGCDLLTHDLTHLLPEADLLCLEPFQPTQGSIPVQLQTPGQFVTLQDERAMVCGWFGQKGRGREIGQTGTREEEMRMRTNGKAEAWVYLYPWEGLTFVDGEKTQTSEEKSSTDEGPEEFRCFVRIEVLIQGDEQRHREELVQIRITPTTRRTVCEVSIPERMRANRSTEEGREGQEKDDSKR